MSAELILITRFGSDDEVVNWFHTLRTAHDTAGDPMEFPTHLREQAGMFDPTMVEEFLQALADTGDAERALDELLELETQMPDLYWQYQPHEDQVVADTGFDWVPQDEAARLAAAWGDEWQGYLGEQLTARWGTDWQAHPDDHKQAWLTDLLPELLGEAGETAPEPVSEEVAAEVSAILDGLLEEELGNLEDDDLSEEEVNELIAELRGTLLDTPATTAQEG